VEIRGLDLNCPGETEAWYRALSEAKSAGLVAPIVTGREAELASLRTPWRLAGDVRLPERCGPAGGQDRAGRHRGRGRPGAGECQLTGWTGLPPAGVLEKLAYLHTLMDADVPSGELSRDPVTYDAARVLRIQERLTEQGYQLVTMLISDRGGEPAAYTTMLVMGPAGQDVLQDSTFVLRSYRGRGLGMLAKTANLRQLTQHFPHARHVHTWTAEVNGAMQTVNARLGFRPMETTHELELELD
jgi:GNAT superfamily N-acetyltransferase